MPTFSASPTDDEIFRARAFEEPLVPVGGATSAPENQALARALTAYLSAGQAEDVRGLEDFLNEHPSSVWRASLLTDLGIVYRRTGRFSKALAAWQQAWDLAKHETEARAAATADHAVGELIELHARVGAMDDLERLFQEIKGRDVRGSATEKIAGARQGLWTMNNRPEVAFRCGPMALDRILASAPASAYRPNERIMQFPSSQRGTSLVQIRSLAQDAGMKMQMARRVRGAGFLTPAVVHWRVGHFAALVREQNGRYLVQDPTFGSELWVSRGTLEDETTGYFLVPEGPLPSGWQAVAREEGGKVWGRGYTAENNPQAGNPCKTPKGGGNSRAGSSGAGSSGGGSSNCPTCQGMATYDVFLMLVSLHLQDSPVGYSPPVGPAVPFTVHYSQRESFQPQTFYYSNLGPKWTFDWLSYVEDNPSDPAASANVYLRGGGQETYSNFNASTQTYGAHYQSQAVLARSSSSPVRYERRLADGSVEAFAQPDGSSTFPRKVFMTQVIDPQGKTVSLTYDASLRLVAIADAIGQVTTLSYELPSDPLRITKVTDPFGRFATFEYNASARLTKITDVIGLESQFEYGPNDFIQALTTSYGTTKFLTGEEGRNRWLEITDPLGGRERVEYANSGALPSTDPAATVPPGFDNNNLNFRNTFYWDKRAMALYPGDYTKARLIHWLHETNTNQTADVIESEKMPIENRVWYAYPGQTSYTWLMGTMTKPSKIARVLDDGTVQTFLYEYNSRGNKTRQTDPVGRATIYNYDAKGIDLLEVRQVNGQTTDLLASYTYNAQHQQLTSADAAGQTTTSTYNASGQILTVTTPPRAGITENRTTTYSYDPVTGNIASVTGPGGVTTSTSTYDPYGRVRTTTDSDGYTLTFDYDALDRVTKTTYPDGTYEEIQYERLDPVRNRDRLGRWTHTFYDALRRPTAIRDAEGRTTTKAEWVSCGSCGGAGRVSTLTDANANTTTWEYDLQGRMTKETRANGSFKSLVYENTTSRLKKVIDAKLQEIQYSYGLDDKPLATTYVNAEHPTPNVTLSYTDPATSAPDAHGRLRSMTDGTGTTTYAYHPFGQLGAGQLASVDGPLANDTISYSYDELGRVVSRTLNGVTSTWAYDALGRLTTLGDPIGNFTYGYVGTTGRVSSVNYPNGQTTSYAYLPVNQDLRLQQIHHKKPNLSTLSKFDYTYDAIGNIVTWAQQTDTNPVQTYTYEYDRADQLTAATLAAPTPKRYRYDYDPASNRILEQIDDASTLSTHDNMNRLTTQIPGGGLVFRGTVSEPGTVTVAGKPATVTAGEQFTGTAPVVGGTTQVEVKATDASGNVRTNIYEVTVTGPSKSFTYNANGNMTSDGTRNFEWDAENRLIAVKQGATTLATFLYDGTGRRVTKAAGGVTTTYVYGGDNFLEERSSAGSTKRYVYGPGIDQVLADVEGTTPFYYVADHLGSVARTTDAGGNPTTLRQYDPWGSLLQGSSTSGYAYTGREWDAETGLYYYRARYYDPRIGRFMSEDPLYASLNGAIGSTRLSRRQNAVALGQVPVLFVGDVFLGLPGSPIGPVTNPTNLYSYASNNPANWSDPSGLLPRPSNNLCKIGCRLLAAVCVLHCPVSGPFAPLCLASCVIFEVWCEKRCDYYCPVRQ